MGRSLEVTVFGCDISSYQASIPPGMDFIFHKCTEGDGYIDPNYAGRHDITRKAGIQWGAYHFFRMSASAQSQVDWFVRHANIQPGDIVALDFEDVSYDPWSNYGSSTVATHAVDVMIRLHAAYPHNRILLYANSSTVRDYVQRYNIPVQDGLWVADYTLRPTMPFMFWQYSSSPIDKDLTDSFNNVAELKAWANIPAPAPSIVEADMFTPLATDHASGRAYVTFEVGNNSSVIAHAWLGVKALWGDINNVTVTFTDDAGISLARQTVNLKQNVRWWLEAPSGSSDVTLEWDPVKVVGTAILDGYVIGK